MLDLGKINNSTVNLMIISFLVNNSVIHMDDWPIGKLKPLS